MLLLLQDVMSDTGARILNFKHVDHILQTCCNDTAVAQEHAQACGAGGGANATSASASSAAVV